LWRIADPDDPGFVVTAMEIEGMAFIPVGPWRGTATEGSTLVLPQFFKADWDTPPSPKCTLTFWTEADGQVLCVGLTVNARQDGTTRAEVTLAGIRNIRIGELKRRATALALVEARREADGSRSFLPVALGEDQALISADALAGVEGKDLHVPHRGKKLSDAHLRKVADVYREALSSEKPQPTKAVMKHFFTVRSNASRWVALARDRGFLTDDETPRTTGPKRTTKRGRNRDK
jgi:hypothetical protein